MSSVYTGLKIFRFPEKLEDLLADRLTSPIHVRLKPTNVCNHRCHYCCYRNPDLYLSERFNQKDSIPPAKLFEIIDDLAEMDVRAVTFSGGGEPLCHPEIEPAVRRLIDNKIKVAMLTNGSLLRGSIAELLAQSATWIRISLDAADGESFAKRRGVKPDEYDRICKNLKAFAGQKNHSCTLGINFIITADNFTETYDFLSAMKDLGVDHVKLSEAVVSVDREANQKYVAGFYPAVRRLIDRAQGKLADSGFTIIDKVYNPNEQPGGGAYDKSYTRCPFVECLVVIAADQCVYTCQDKAYTGRGLLGSLADQRFRDLWASGDTLAKIRSLDPSRVCRHHCVADAKNKMLLEFLGADPKHLEFV